MDIIQVNFFYECICFEVIAIDASFMASESVGWACEALAMSSEHPFCCITIANSWIISPAFFATKCAPKIRSVSLWANILTNPFYHEII